MKNWIIKHWILSYDTKVFGKKWRHLRVVNTLWPLFIIAGLINLLIPGFGIGQSLAFLPFAALFIWSCVYKLKQSDIQHLDWEQELQLMQKPDYAKEKFSFELPQKKNLIWYKDKHDYKYKGEEKFVEAWRFFHPVIWLLLACIIWAIFGFNEAGFPELRGF